MARVVACCVPHRLSFLVRIMSALLIIILFVLIVSLLCIAWYIEQRLDRFERKMDQQGWIKLDKLSIDLTVSDAVVEYTVNAGVEGQYITANYVQKWLDDRGLMMAPKGQDFAVKARASS
jgi:hypothetical protein